MYLNETPSLLQPVLRDANAGFLHWRDHTFAPPRLRDLTLSAQPLPK